MSVNIAILSILVSAPIGLLCIQILGPKLLECDGTDDEAVMHKADESIHSGTSGLSSRKSIVLSHLANIEERLVELERTVAGPEGKISIFTFFFKFHISFLCIFFRIKQIFFNRV